MDNDDQQIGEILTRRKALKLFGLTGGALGAGLMGSKVLAGGAGGPPPPPVGGPGQGPPPGGPRPGIDGIEGPGGAGGTSAGTSGAQSLPGCIVRPALTEGPYFVANELGRSDIRSDTDTKAVKPGVPLTLTFAVSRIGMGVCEPRPDIKVDLWHCDALGVYSGAQDPGYDTTGLDFLRGYQLTNAQGRATFRTIYPGWYSGRAVHFHFTLSVITGGKVTGQFTSQLFFPETVNDTVHAVAPYRQKGKRDTLNARDNIYQNGGNQLLLDLRGSPSAGYTSTFDVGLNI